MNDKYSEININNEQSQNYNITNSEIDIEFNIFLAVMHVFLFFLFIRVVYILHLKYCTATNTNIERNNPIIPFINEYIDINPNNDDICSICLEKLNQNRVIKLRCNHLYHEKCIEQWLSIKKICPLCNSV